MNNDNKSITDGVSAPGLEQVKDKKQSSFGFMQDVQPITRSFRIGIVGGTGLVGQVVLEILKERNFPVVEVTLFGSAASRDNFIETPYGMLGVQQLKPRKIPELDFVFMAAGARISQRWARSFAHKGALVIDKTSYFRNKLYAPLVVPEVNARRLLRHRNIISSPNCTTIPVVMVLNGLNKSFGLKRITAVSFQSVSGSGKQGISALENEIRDPNLPASTFSHRIAHNVIPWIGSGSLPIAEEEKKLVQETRRILELPRLSIRSTSVRVPTFVGHGIAVHADFDKSFSINEAREIISMSRGVTVIDKPQSGKYPTPNDAAGQDEVFVGRIRRDYSSRKALAFWVVTDNLRKGAATNAVQIAEELIDLM